MARFLNSQDLIAAGLPDLIAGFFTDLPEVTLDDFFLPFDSNYNNAFDRIAAKYPNGISIRLKSKSYKVNDANVRGKTKMVGNGTSSSFIPDTGATRLFKTQGLTGLNNHDNFSYIYFENILFNGQGVADSYWAKGVSHLYIHDCRFSGGVNYAVHGEELWDSWITGNVAKSFLNANGKAIFYLTGGPLDEGTPDNTNQIRITANHFENYVIPAIWSVGTAGQKTRNNELYLHENKFESDQPTIGVRLTYTVSTTLSANTWTMVRGSATATNGLLLESCKFINVMSGGGEYLGTGTMYNWCRATGPSCNHLFFSAVSIYGDGTTTPVPVLIDDPAITTHVSTFGCVLDDDSTRLFQTSTTHQNLFTGRLVIGSKSGTPQLWLRRDSVSTGPQRNLYLQIKDDNGLGAIRDDDGDILGWDSGRRLFGRNGRVQEAWARTTSQRNSLAAGVVSIGFSVFDTDIGKPIWVKTISPSVVWVDATGATV